MSACPIQPNQGGLLSISPSLHSAATDQVHPLTRRRLGAGLTARAPHSCLATAASRILVCRAAVGIARIASPIRRASVVSGCHPWAMRTWRSENSPASSTTSVAVLSATALPTSGATASIPRPTAPAPRFHGFGAGLLHRAKRVAHGNVGGCAPPTTRQFHAANVETCSDTTRTPPASYYDGVGIVDSHEV